MRLNEAILQTEDYFTNIVLATLMSDVQIMHLRLPIRKHMPTLLDEFIKCIDKYIDQQESVVVFDSWRAKENTNRKDKKHERR